MRQIIKSLVCPRSYGRNFYSIFMKFFTEVGIPKNKKAFVWGSPIYFAPIFHPRNAFPTGRFKYHSNESRGPIVEITSSNYVPQGAANYCKML